MGKAIQEPARGGESTPKIVGEGIVETTDAHMLLKVAFALGLIFPVLVRAVLKALLVIPIK